ncbi:MAG: hypothetical protein WED09_01690 [Homoserinimonas sp.]
MSTLTATVFDDIDDFNGPFGDFTEQEVDSRGRLESSISHATVLRIAKRIDDAGVVAMLENWELIDNPVPGNGGRPRTIGHRAILVGLLLLAAERNSMWLRNLNRLFYRRLTPESREYLGLPTSVTSFGIAAREENRWEKNVANAFHRLLRPMDPYPMKRHKSLLYVEIREVLEAHDANREKTARHRLNQFTNALVMMTYFTQPREIRRISKKLDISFDQTAVESPTSSKYYAPKQMKKKVEEELAAIESGDFDKMQRASRTTTVDPHAGYHFVSADRRDDLTPGSKHTESPKKGEKRGDDYVWGWELNLAVRVDSEHPTGNRFPQLVTAATISMPNVGVSEEAVELMRYSLATGLQPGLGDADKQYWANALPERLHHPAPQLGWTPSTDYRIDRLGPQGKKGELGSKGGVEFIEGARLCPGTPDALKMASVHHVQDKIDKPTYKIRIAERRAFQVRPKEKPDAKGRQPVSCPARGNSPGVTCPIFELLMERDGKKLPTVADKPWPRVELDDAPDLDQLPAICRQHSVSLNAADDARTTQGMPYMSEEWEEFHDYARNSIESVNADVKGAGHESIASKGRRKVRGFAAAAVIFAIQLTQYNLRTIATFLKERAIAAQLDKPEWPPAQPIRRRDAGAVNLYTKTLPRDPLLARWAEGELFSPLRT